jgi:RNA polymerase sigma-70 factor, ECF subfamily
MKGGSELADWAAIVSEHGETAWRTAYRLLGNSADAADCVQDAFLSAFSLSRRQTVLNWGGMLVRLTTCKSLDRLRQRKTSRLMSAQLPEGAEFPADQVSPPQAAESAELAENLRLAIAKLPRQQAEAFCLRNLNDLSYEQIACEMGVEVSHVGVLLHRAKAMLKKLIVSDFSTHQGGGKP